MPNDSQQPGYLIWWRESADWHTLVTLWMKPIAALAGATRFSARMTIYDTAGHSVYEWSQELGADDCLFIASVEFSGRLGNAVSDGVLHIQLASIDPLRASEVEPQSLHAIVDWYSDGGDIATLHTDQITTYQSTTQLELTEISVCESESERNELVLLNGPSSQPPESVKLSVLNHRGDVREIVATEMLNPFTVSRFPLSKLIADVDEFADNEPLLVTGHLRLKDCWIRPYVVSSAPTFGAYHGGNKYEWSGLPKLLFKFMGQGETNPMFVDCSEHVTTYVNVFNTHGDIEKDFWIDADLIDESGRVIARRANWLMAKWGDAQRASVRDLLPDGISRFRGHISLRFSRSPHEVYPRRLQALLEYRTASSVSRIMAWSDQWNWSVRRERAKQVRWVTYYRVWVSELRATSVALTNAGVDADYSSTAKVSLTLKNGSGRSQAIERSIPPQGTLYATITELFPTASECLAGQLWGIVVAESEFDLANVALTYDQASGACAAEHFLYVCCPQGEGFATPAGG